MAWHMTGRFIEACSCKAACPCVLGPAEPDQGWCSGALTFAIEDGESEGVSLGGRDGGLAHRPAEGLSQRERNVRIYVDDGADASQLRELEAIFTGKRGGPGEVLASLVKSWLPTQKARIALEGGDEPSIAVDGIGQVQLKRIADEKGRVAKLTNAPVLGAIQVETAELARSDGSSFADPQMRRWESGGHGSVSPFSWQV